MADTASVIRLRFPKTADQADRLKRLARRDNPIPVSITVLPDRNRFREQRAWRLLFGLYQDCACVDWSKGFKKTPGVPFIGMMKPSRLALFLREAMPLIVDSRAEVHFKGEKVRRRLMDVMAA